MSNVTAASTSSTDDPAARLTELRRVRAALWPDRDDAETLSQLVVVQTQIMQLEAELGIRHPGSHHSRRR